MSFKSPEPLPDDEGEDSNLAMRGLLLMLMRRFLWILLFAVLAGVCSYYYVWKLPRAYQATAVIEIESQEQGTLSFNDEGARNLKDPDVIETIVRRFGYRLLMERLATHLDLMNDRSFLGNEDKIPAPINSVVNALIAQSKAEIQPGTRLINVSFTHPNPLVAQRLANGLVNQFLTDEKDERKNTLETQNGALEATAKKLRDDVKLSELKMQDYKEKSGSVSLEDRYNLVAEKLRALNTDLSVARGDRLRLEADRGMIKTIGDDSNKLLTVPSVALDLQVKDAREKWMTQQADIAALSKRYGPRHPKMIEAQAQLENAHETFLASINTAPDRLDSSYQAALGKEQSLQSAVTDQEASLLKLENIMIPFRALQREYESNRTLLQQVLQKTNESALALTVTPVSFHVVENATPGKPMANKRMLYILGASFAGALLAIGLIATAFLLDTSIKTVDEAEKLLGLPVLAGVPAMKAAPPLDDSLTLISKADSPIAESFRTLRTALSLSDGAERKIFLFTSAIASEGKSFTVANTAVAFAQQGLRTVVIDADLRRPTAHKLLCKDKLPVAGLGEYLMGKNLEITPTGIENLSIMAAGGNVRKPAELLTLPRFRELVSSLANSYDRVIIDTAPVNLVSDTLNIVPAAEVVCLVVRSNSTPRKVVKRAIELLHRVNVRPLGIVLGQLPLKNGFDYYHSYSAGSKYGTANTYASEDADSLATPAQTGSQMNS